MSDWTGVKREELISIISLASTYGAPELGHAVGITCILTLRARERGGLRSHVKLKYFCGLSVRGSV